MSVKYSLITEQNEIVHKYKHQKMEGCRCKTTTKKNPQSATDNLFLAFPCSKHKEVENLLC